MTIIACGDEYTDETKEALDEAAKGYNSKITQEVWGEVFERDMPEVERAIEERCVECLENQAKNAQEAMRESLKDAPSTTELEKQDLEIWPSREEREIMVKTGKELGMSTADKIYTPPIVGTPGVENMKEKIRDVMEALHTSEIPPWFRDVNAFSKIMFVDKQGEEGITGPKVADFNTKTGVLHIYRNQEGKFPSIEEIRQKILPHETFHANRDGFMERIEANKYEWMKVNENELQLPSEYIGKLEEAWRKDEISTALRDEELAAEWYKRYITDQCSETTAEFFNKYFSE